MTVREFKNLINSIPEKFDENVILLPEGIHSSQNIYYYIDPLAEEDACVVISCA